MSAPSIYTIAPTSLIRSQFLDEADLLADEIAILAAPGKLVAHGPPVALKQTLGEGYAIHATFDSTQEKDLDTDDEKGDRLSLMETEFLRAIREVAPETSLSRSQRYSAYHLHNKDLAVVERVVMREYRVGVSDGAALRGGGMWRATSSVGSSWAATSRTCLRDRP